MDVFESSDGEEGVSRSAVWYPTIFPDKCDGCIHFDSARCVDFCPHNVFEIRDGKAIVINPQNCVYGCIACAMMCPGKAIVFPQRSSQTVATKVRDKGLLWKVKCKECGKVFWTNREVNICMDCEGRR